MMEKNCPMTMLAMMEGAKLGLAMIEGSQGWQRWGKNCLMAMMAMMEGAKQ